MSTMYFLVCMDCKTGINLGKAVHTVYEDIGVSTFGFAEVGLSLQGVWKPSWETARNLNHFLMLHRTHELRVLPDRAERFASNFGFPHAWPAASNDLEPRYDQDLFLRTETARPDPDKEIESLAPELIEKLRKF